MNKKETYWANTQTGELFQHKPLNLKIFAYRFFHTCYGTRWSDIKKYKR